MSTEYTFKSNDTKPVIEDQLPGDLTEAGGSVVFSMKPVGPEGPIVERENASIGQYRKADDVTDVSYELEESETSDSGEYLAEFEATYPDGEVQTFPKGKYYFITIREDIA